MANQRRSHRRYSSNAPRMGGSPSRGRGRGPEDDHQIDDRLRHYMSGNGFVCPCCSTRFEGHTLSTEKKVLKHLGLGGGTVRCTSAKALLRKWREGDSSASRQLDWMGLNVLKVGEIPGQQQRVVSA